MARQAPTTSAVHLAGDPVSEGHARGPLHRLRRPDEGGRDTAAMATGDPGAEAGNLRNALASASAELARLLASLADEQARIIVEFQLAMLEDEEFVEPAFAAITDGRDARTAWRKLAEFTITDYTSSEDEYFRARAADIRDLYERVTAALEGRDMSAIPPGVIVLADDITPTQFLQTDWDGGGIALLGGSSTSHVAMLARSRGIPMIVRIRQPDPGIEGTALLDGVDGTLVLNPDADAESDFHDRSRAAEARRTRERKHLDTPAVTADGEAVAVYINIAGLDDLEHTDPAHCDGIGLVRTEFLYHERIPDEQDQYDFYRGIVDWAGGKPVTIRTLDAGGDKPIPGITPTDEANPFLGVRGIRLSLQRPDVFRPQLRAILRASAAGPIRLLLPMVTHPREVAAVRTMVEEIGRELGNEGIERGVPRIGIMVEVPAAAVAIDEFDIDFCSIGSNDLVQYVTACARDAGDLGELATPTATAVLRLIETVVAHGRTHGIEVSLCGDAAADVRYIGALLDTGLRAVSVAPAALARTKATIAAYRGTANDR